MRASKGRPVRRKKVAVKPQAGDKYHRILDAAVVVFAAKGFHSARVSDVADLASVGDGTIYLYFRNKEELLMTAIKTAFDGFMSRARTELAAIDSPAGKLHRLACLHLEALGSNRNLAVVFQMELRQSARFLAPFSRNQMAEYLGLVRSTIADGQARGEFRPEMNVKLAANCFFGALDEMVTSWVLDNTHYHIFDVADSVANIILKGLET